MLFVFGYTSSVYSQNSYEKTFLRFYNNQSLASKVNAFDTLNSFYKLRCYDLVKEDLALIKEKALEDNQEEVLDKLYKIEGEMFYNFKNYSKAIPIFTDLLARNKIKTLKDSVQVLYI